MSLLTNRLADRRTSRNALREPNTVAAFGYWCVNLRPRRRVYVCHAWPCKGSGGLYPARVQLASNVRCTTVFVAIGFRAVSFTQSTTIVATIVSGIDPSDIAAIPEPDLLGPLIGVVSPVASVTYDAAAVTSSVLALIIANTDAQTTVIASPAEPDTSSTPTALKKSFNGGNTNIHRRDTKYPIDTKSFVRGTLFGQVGILLWVLFLPSFELGCARKQESGPSRIPNVLHTFGQGYCKSEKRGWGLLYLLSWLLSICSRGHSRPATLTIQATAV